ncbi:MAG: 50S ribosomal protein L21 [Rhodospirillales bacterium]|nr:50S ribosomal protein L21 [Rhodospirillales bacterium]
MFAVIRSGGKQHRVSESDRITVEKLDAEPGDLVAFDRVLMLGGDGGELLVGASVPPAARVFGRVITPARGPKLIIFKKKRRKNHRRTRGHRQHLTEVQIAAISLDGQAPAAAAAEPEPVAEIVAERVLEPALQE